MDAHHPTIQSVLRAEAREALSEQARRANVRQELEAEAKGLLMAARMHGFMVNVMNGTATVIDSRGAA